MPGVDISDDQQYSTLTGLVYIFNLIVGTGALALPKAFGGAGWGLGLGFILALAFMSYITVTLVIETMSIANAILKSRREDENQEPSLITNRQRIERERDPLIPPELLDQNDELQQEETLNASFEIKERVEMGRMASMFFGRIGLYMFYLCIAVYLYGDLAIYIAVVSKSLRDAICVKIPVNSSVPEAESDPCFHHLAQSIDRGEAYRIFTVIFMLFIGPFVFFNVQKTKYLQVTTTMMRWLAFGLMITMATLKIANGEGATQRPRVARITALPNLFGVCVYSFMCHHSLPSLVTPISSKKHLYKLFVADYVMITLFYLLLAFTGIFAFDFDDLRDVYTLNFEATDGETASPAKVGIQYFLNLFPVFTLSTNFPIIAITLKNNLKSIFQIHDDEQDENSSLIMSLRYGRYKQFWTNLVFPLLAIIPPFLIAIFEEDVINLVSVTGSYAGAGIQYVIPVFLVYIARKSFISTSVNPYASPFKSSCWLFFVILWAFVSIVFVTWSKIYSIEPPAVTM